MHLKMRPATLVKIETPSQVLSCEFREIFNNPVSDVDYRQVHAHTHLQRPVAPHKVITSLHQRPVKQALHHTII